MKAFLGSVFDSFTVEKETDSGPWRNTFASHFEVPVGTKVFADIGLTLKDRNQVFRDLIDAAVICERNSDSGSSDERQAWAGMATRLRSIADISARHNNSYPSKVTDNTTTADKSVKDPQ